MFELNLKDLPDYVLYGLLADLGAAVEIRKDNAPNKDDILMVWYKFGKAITKEIDRRLFASSEE